MRNERKVPAPAEEGNVGVGLPQQYDKDRITAHRSN